MKRLLVLLVAMIMCVGLCACGGTNPEEDIVGTWWVDRGSGIAENYRFYEDEHVEMDLAYNNFAQKTYCGTYAIEEDSITITWDEGTVYNLLFYYSEDIMCIQYSTGEKTFFTKISDFCEESNQ